MLPVFHAAACTNSPELVSRTDQGTSSEYGFASPGALTMCCGFFFCITTLVPRYVGVDALPNDTPNVLTVCPSDVTVIRSLPPSTVDTWAAPMFIERVRLSSNASPGPAL